MLSRFTAALVAALVLAACDRGLGDDTLARAGDYRFQVEEAAAVLAENPQLPPDREVVQALSDLWIDYTLLAHVHLADPDFGSVDLSDLIRQETEQELVHRLREQVIQVDTALTDDDLRELYEEEGGGERVSARHILLRYPSNADQAQRDSVRELAESLRDRARAGEDFGELAREYSDDPGSAGQGGDLGTFDRGDMVAPFEQAAFALDPGEVSDVVETPFGLHVILVEGRESRPFEDVRDQLRRDAQQQMIFQAESLFVAEVEEEASMEVQNGAADRVRELAADAEEPLSSRRAGRALVRYEGGSYTEGDFREFILSQPPPMRENVAQAGDEDIEGFLLDLTRGELLVHEARRQGIEIPADEEEALREEYREQYREVARLLGIAEIEVEEGESTRQAVEREVGELLRRIVHGEQDVYPLGALGRPLRSAYDARTNEGAMDRTAERVAVLRDAAPPPPAEDPEILPEELPEDPAAELPDPPGEGDPDGG